MTIAAAWIRTLNDCTELVAVSDSRLNGGKKIDCAQKLFRLPRSDSFICFAGDTSWAFPLMNQVISAISQYPRSADRAQDIGHLLSHVLKIFDGLRGFVHDTAEGEDVPGAEFIFGGYSWFDKCFKLWRIAFNQSKNRFVAYRAEDNRGSASVFAGDQDLVLEARKRMFKLLNEKGKGMHDVPMLTFNWEPFEVIRDMLREARKDDYLYRYGSIGGAPQILKVYEHLSSQYIGVRWKEDSALETYVCGRRLLPYETSSAWLLEPDTLLTSHELYSRGLTSRDSEGQPDGVETGI